MNRSRTGASPRPRAPRAQIHLPPLTTHEALLLSNLLDRTLAALWRTYGDAVGELLADRKLREDGATGPIDPVPQDPATALFDDDFF